jgi:hypothetical protein
VCVCVCVCVCVFVCVFVCFVWKRECVYKKKKILTVRKKILQHAAGE